MKLKDHPPIIRKENPKFHKGNLLLQDNHKLEDSHKWVDNHNQVDNHQIRQEYHNNPLINNSLFQLLLFKNLKIQLNYNLKNLQQEKYQQDNLSILKKELDNLQVKLHKG